MKNILLYRENLLKLWSYRVPSTKFQKTSNFMQIILEIIAKTINSTTSQILGV